MLILTRRINESIIINDETNVRILAVRGNQVRLRIEAPKKISVHREEIYQKIQAEKVEKTEQNAEIEAFIEQPV